MSEAASGGRKEKESERVCVCVCLVLKGGLGGLGRWEGRALRRLGHLCYIIAGK